MVTEFKEGDVVQLKSGGPKMTIQDISEHEDGNVLYCKWFIGKELGEGHFESVSLVKAEESHK